jgi:hypothetical protein
MRRRHFYPPHGNFLKSTPENKAGYVWAKGQQWASVGMSGPVKLL